MSLAVSSTHAESAALRLALAAPPTTAEYVQLAADRTTRWRAILRDPDARSMSFDEKRDAAQKYAVECLRARRVEAAESKYRATAPEIVP